MNSLIEIEGDVFAANELAAVVVFPPNEDEDEEQWIISLLLRGGAEPVKYYADTEADAREMQLKAVAAWKNALARP
ncbi:MAG: hypothetical protein NTW03_08320 [Verrucomicrobia bacterium]|nr:hypothetical protein [Verrucomicrobiota bacterium]